MNIEKLLTFLGLDEKEAMLYITLLRIEFATIAELSRESGIYRPALYRYLPKLESMDLVRKQQKGKRVYYRAASPKYLLEQLDILKCELDQAAESLEAVYEKQESRPSIQYYEGKKGIRKTLADMLQSVKKGEVYYRYGARKGKSRNPYLPANYEEVRDKKDLQRFVITNPERAEHIKKSMNRYMKTVPENVLFEDNMQIMIYANKISIVDYEDETGIIIEHGKLAKFQKKLFRLLFERI